MTEPASQQAVVPPKIPTGQEVFDAIMGHIEPELTTEGRKTIDEKYKNETPENKEARRERYAQAFERYQQAYEGYMQTFAAQVERYQRDSFSALERQDRQKDNTTLNALSQQFA